MSRAVLFSVQPRWCLPIARREKTVEVRKTRPTIEPPFRGYLYCTMGNRHEALVVNSAGASLIVCDNWRTAIPVGGVIGNGKVIGEFVCSGIDEFTVGSLACDEIERLACMTYGDMVRYFYPDGEDGTLKFGYGLSISGLVLYDRPREIRDFYQVQFMRSNGGRMQKFRNRLQAPPQSWCYVEESAS